MKNPVVLVVLLFASLVAGCGQKLSGTYEMIADIPRMEMPGNIDPNLRRQMDDAHKQIQAISRQTLEFNGSKVKMGSSAAVTEYSYRIKGQQLEILAEAMGQKTTLPMKIEPDGSITYMGMSYRKVE